MPKIKQCRVGGTHLYPPQKKSSENENSSVGITDLVVPTVP